MDIYKQICAKLVEAWDNTADGEYEDFGRAASYLVDWTRDALAEPEPEGPTDEELEEEFGRALLSLPGDSMNATAVAFARAVLAHWGK